MSPPVELQSENLDHSSSLLSHRLGDPAMQRKARKNKCKKQDPTFVAVFDTFTSSLQCGRGDIIH